MSEMETENLTDEESFRAARRKKLESLKTMGIDPWGQRFDDRDLIGEIRSRSGEIRVQTKSGDELELPGAEELESLNFRDWLKEQDASGLSGPKVRAAGRIMLHRDTGKLQFIDIEDWTGRIPAVRREETGSVTKTGS